MGLGLLLAVNAHASQYVIDVSQVGNDVVFTGSGSVDLNGLSPIFPTGSNSGGLSAYFAVVSVGSSGAVYSYEGLSGPSSYSFKSMGDVNSNADTGPNLEVQGEDGDLFLPTDYISGDPLGTSTSTYDNTTIAGLNLIPGSYEWTWLSGSNSITLNIPSAPEPGSTVALLALALVPLGALRRLRS